MFILVFGLCSIEIEKLFSFFNNTHELGCWISKNTLINMEMQFHTHSQTIKS